MQSGKKDVEKIKASKAIEAGSAIKDHETITTKSRDTISDARTVDAPRPVCQTADAHGQLCRLYSHLRTTASLLAQPFCTPSGGAHVVGTGTRHAETVPAKL